MDHLLNIAMASLAAAISPALAMAVFILAFGGRLFDPWMLIFLLAIAAIALAYTVLFGLLTVGWLIQKRRFRARPMLAAGLVIGAVPTALWQHPWKRWGAQSEVWVKGIQVEDNGSLTWAGWWQYGQQITVAAILGAIGTLAFYHVYKDIYPHLATRP